MRRSTWKIISAKKGPVFGGPRLKAIPAADRLTKAAELAPVLRGFCSSRIGWSVISRMTTRVLEFINSNDLARLAPMGTSCPDHFLRTKISPLVLDLSLDQDLRGPDYDKRETGAAVRALPGDVCALL